MTADPERPIETGITSSSPPIPTELWMLWIPWEKYPGRGHYVFAEDDIQGSNPYLVFKSLADAEVAARWYETEYGPRYGTRCFPVCVREAMS